jgi:hypothetical protein
MKNVMDIISLAAIFGLGMVSGSMAGGSDHARGMDMRKRSDLDSNGDGAVSLEGTVEGGADF